MPASRMMADSKNFFITKILGNKKYLLPQPALHDCSNKGMALCKSLILISQNY
jgi:hypothetical protein